MATIHYFPVRYSWTGKGGRKMHGRSVAAGPSEAEAWRIFFRLHRHVRPDLRHAS